MEPSTSKKRAKKTKTKGSTPATNGAAAVAPTGPRNRIAAQIVNFVEEQRHELVWAASNIEDLAQGDVENYSINSLRSQLLQALALTAEIETLASILVDTPVPREVKS